MTLPYIQPVPAEEQGYYDPYYQATGATGERVDQGLDTSSGKGTLAAIADGVITQILGPSSGWPGNYIQYKVTEQGPLLGQLIYYAEGVSPVQGLAVGDTVARGQAVANLTPGWPTGIETGFAAGVGSESYAMAHGGFSESSPNTASGTVWAEIVKALGGPVSPDLAKPENKIYGQAPLGNAAIGQIALGNQSTTPGAGVNAAVSGAAGTVAGAASTAAKTAESLANLAGDVAGFLSSPEKALLTVGLIVLGVMLVYSGVGRAFGVDQPIKSTAQSGAKAAAAGRMAAA